MRTPFHRVLAALLLAAAPLAAQGRRPARRRLGAFPPPQSRIASGARWGCW